MTEIDRPKTTIRKNTVDKSEEKTCFIIMPISDMDGYENGHFSRVYNHLIRPACQNAGYLPIRADEVVSSNYIVIDILSRIVESDLVICDLSGKNPNVLYELGIRQAFNLPTVLINDKQTGKIFDIQGLRYTEYDQALRVDSVEYQIEAISKSITETISANGKDINSLIQLLGIKAATVPSQVELSNETSVVLSAIKDLSKRLISVEQSQKQHFYNFSKSSFRSEKSDPAIEISNNGFYINGRPVSIGENLYQDGTRIGVLLDVSLDEIILDGQNGVFSIPASSKNFSRINDIPF